MAAALLCLLAPSAVADLRARDVRVEFAQSPVVGVAVLRPRFSWALEHAPGGVQRRRARGAARRHARCGALLLPTFTSNVLFTCHAPLQGARTAARAL